VKKTSYTAFVDEFTRQLAAESIILDCVSNVKWDDDREVLLIQAEPKHEDVYEEVKEIIMARIRTIEGLDFVAKAWEGKIGGRKTMIFKIIPDGSDGKSKDQGKSTAPKDRHQGSNPVKKQEPQTASQAGRDR